MSSSPANPVKPSARTTLLAAGGGVILLAVVLGFVVGLPKVSGDEGAGGTTQAGELAPLPDELPGGLISLTSPDVPPELLAQTGGPDQLADITASAEDNLAALFGSPTAFAVYGAADGSALLTVTVGPGEPGLFVPDGAPVSAEVQGVTRSDLEITRIADDTVCSILYSQPLAAGQTADPAEQPARVHCQVGDDGLLYDVTGQGLSVDQVVAAADAARDSETTPAT